MEVSDEESTMEKCNGGVAADEEPTVPKKKMKRSLDGGHELSKAAMKALPGSRAGVVLKSDDMGCDHFGVDDMFMHGKVEPGQMNYYLSEGRFLFNNACDECGTLAKDLNKKKCNSVDQVYVYVCDEGCKGRVICDKFLCFTCVMKRKGILEERKEEERKKKEEEGGQVVSKRASRRIRG